MTPVIRFPRHQIADLESIRDLSLESLRHALESLNQIQPVPQTSSKIQEDLTKHIGKEGAAPLLRQLLSLHGMARQLDLRSEEVFNGLRTGLRSGDVDWSEEQLNKWDSLSDLLQKIFDLEVIRLSSKALDLSYEHSELLQRARILTDLRPVFNDDADAIKGAVISHSLLLRYDDIEGNHVLNLAIDEKDIGQLIKQCERALRKSQLLQNHITDRAGLSVIVPGKNTDE